MKIKKHIKIFFALLLSLSFTLTACGNASNDNNSKETNQIDSADANKDEKNENSTESGDKPFIVAADYIPKKIHSSFLEDSVTTITAPIYDPLFWIEKDGFNYRIVDNLDISEDGKVYKLHINDKANWSDGNPITSKDIEFSIDYNQELIGLTFYKTDYVTGEAIQFNIIDDKTCEFILPNPSNYFIKVLSVLNVVPSHPFDGDVKKAVNDNEYFHSPDMATSGAYRVEEINEDSLVYKARDDYYRGKAKTDTVIMKVFGDGQTKEVAFNNGELSYLRVLTKEDYDKYANQPDKYNIFSFPESRVNFIQVNPNGPIMKDMNDDAREAIFLALNQQEILDLVYGSEEMATLSNSILTPEGKGYNPENPFYEQNLERAKQLAESSGLSGKKLTYIYNKNSRTGMDKVAVIVQQQLANIGVDLEIKALDSPTFFQVYHKNQIDPEAKGEFDLGTQGWNSQIYKRVNVFEDLTQQKKWGWSDDVFSSVMAMNKEADDQKYDEIMKDIQQKAHDEFRMYTLPYPYFNIVTTKNITGLDTSHNVPEFGDYLDIEVK